MDERAIFWPDVQSVLDSPTFVRSDGLDAFGRARWLVRGVTDGNLKMELVCALDSGHGADETVFITIYWE